MSKAANKGYDIFAEPEPAADNATLLKMLEKPKGVVDVVLDTDTFNEIDDQFAIGYLIQSEDRLKIKAIYAAPFYNHHSSSPEDGMNRSYAEIERIYDFIGENRFRDVTFKGATHFLKDEKTPSVSAAAQDLAERAMQYTTEKPLYVIGIAACTNIASALLLKPEIKERIVVLWLGGLSLDWPDNRSFNAGQDVAAARVLLDSGAPVVLFPGRGVVNVFHTSGPELEYWLRGKNKFCDYLIDIVEKEARIFYSGDVWSRTIWDVTPIGWLLSESFMKDKIINSPVMQYDHRYSFDPRRHLIKYVYHIERDNLMNDLFKKLAKFK